MPINGCVAPCYALTCKPIVGLALGAEAELLGHCIKIYTFARMPAEEDVEPDDYPVVAAVVENRAAEVGIAMLSTDTMTLRLVQLVEMSRSYTNVLSLLTACKPAHLVTVASNQALNLGVNRATRACFHQVNYVVLACMWPSKTLP